MGFEYNNSFSIGGWFYFNNDTDTLLVYKQESSGNSRGWVLRKLANYQLMIGLVNTVSNQVQIRATANLIIPNTWFHLFGTYDGSTLASGLKLYINGSQVSTTTTANTLGNNTILNSVSCILNNYLNGKTSNTQVYNRALSASEILQNYNALKTRLELPTASPYVPLTYLATGTITLTNNGTDNVSMFKTSGTTAWDSHFYSTTPFTAPCTIEFNKQSAATDNGVSYAMISWNADPTLDANYTSLDYASYPYQTSTYAVYNNGTLMINAGTWSTANKFYIVYDTDGFIRHYNGSSLLYSVNSGTGRTVYVDSSLYSVNATFGGFSNVRVRRNSWNGTSYV